MTRNFGRVQIQKKSSKSVLLVVMFLLAGGLLSCAIVGQPYRVAPPISGTLRGPGTGSESALLRLSVIHRENPSLSSVQRISVAGAEGHFAFNPVDLKVAGREYSKVYRVYLNHRVGSLNTVIWRGEFSRFEAPDPIILDCDLSRPARLGQPCQVEEPLRHAWLVETGRQTFERLCVDCHGPPTTGRSKIAALAATEAPDLTQISARRPVTGFDPVEIAEWIEGTSTPREHGDRKMPIWGERLSDDFSRYQNADELVGATLDPLLVYLLSIQR